MKKFAVRISVFAFFIVATAFILQAIISFQIKGKSILPNDNIEVTAHQNADLVFLGSSRCWVQFDPYFFNQQYHLKSVNLGIDGHSEMIAAITRLKVYLSENKAPKYAILNFDPLVNAKYRNKNLVQKDLFARYAFFPKPSVEPIMEYFQYTFAEKYVPLYAVFKYQLLGKYLFLKNGGHNPYGFGLNNETWDTVKNPVSDLMKKHYRPFGQTEQIKNALSELQNICKEKNIELMCIQTPVYKIIHIDSAFAEQAIVCKSLNIPFIDANLPIFRNNINYFYNTDHLNKKGVEKLNVFFSQNAELANFLQ